MPKIRGIKPDYWTDEDIVDLSIAARLLFIGLWSYACDNGHLQDKPKQIKMRIFPGDHVSAAELLRELAAGGRIMRVDGWIIIPNFTKHQRPDKRYFQTCEKAGCERPSPDSQPGTRGGHDESTTGTRSSHDVGSMGPHVDGEGDGDGEMKVTTTSSADKPRTTKKRATTRPADFRPTDAHVALANELGVDLRAEWQQFCDHHDAKGSTYKDWPAALRTWIRNATKYGNRRTAADQPSNVQQHLALARRLAAEEQGQMIPFPRLEGGAR